MRKMSEFLFDLPCSEIKWWPQELLTEVEDTVSPGPEACMSLLKPPREERYC